MMLYSSPIIGIPRFARNDISPQVKPSDRFSIAQDNLSQHVILNPSALLVTFGSGKDP